MEASDRRGIDGCMASRSAARAGAVRGAADPAASSRLRGAFPELVGARRSTCSPARCPASAMPAEVRTPHAVLTPETSATTTRASMGFWTLRPRRAGRALVPRTLFAAAGRPPRVIGFVPHYPAHDWYRNMIRAMQRPGPTRSALRSFRIAAPQAGIAPRDPVAAPHHRARCGRRIVGRRHDHRQCRRAEPRSLPTSWPTAAIRDITVVTNSFDIMERLNGTPGVKVILTSGEYHARHRCLVGPSLGALFETLRVDKAFLSVDGVTARFGASSADERLALAAPPLHRRLAGNLRARRPLAHRLRRQPPDRAARAVTEVITDFRFAACQPARASTASRDGSDHRRRGAGRRQSTAATGRRAA